MKHIAVDMDDVIVDLTGGLRQIVKREYGVEVPEFDQWDMNVILKPILGRAWMSWFRERDWLWATLPAVEGAIGSLDILHREGYYLECITSKPDWARYSVWKWMARWRPYFDQVTIVGADDVKADFTTADLLIDDKWENCLGFYNQGRQAILFDRPHNRRGPSGAKCSHGAEIRRAAGWAAVREAIHAL